MPVLQVKTISAASVWKSPDGQREIFELQLEYEGKPVKAKTYSKDIATPGWQGVVDTYEKEGRNGNETFVKQPPKEGGYSPSQQGSRPSGYGGGSSKSFSADPFTMYLSYAKDLAVALLGTKEGFDEAKYGELLEAVSLGGKTLYDGRPGAEPKEASQDITVDTGIDVQQLNAVFGDVEVEKPWQES